MRPNCPSFSLKMAMHVHRQFLSSISVCSGIGVLYLHRRPRVRVVPVQSVVVVTVVVVVVVVVVDYVQV